MMIVQEDTTGYRHRKLKDCICKVFAHTTVILKATGRPIKCENVKKINFFSNCTDRNRLEIVLKFIIILFKRSLKSVNQKILRNSIYYF